MHLAERSRETLSVFSVQLLPQLGFSYRITRSFLEILVPNLPLNVFLYIFLVLSRFIPPWLHLILKELTLVGLSETFLVRLRQMFFPSDLKQMELRRLSTMIRVD
jgi:hypothetical protein